MERVQITGQAGDGQYYDNKGRLLYAMGDINITPGMWVWTNGKTIYGHQTAGEQPTLTMGNGIMPFIASPINDEGGISEIDGAKLSIKKFFENGQIYAFVGDEKHAYIQTRWNEWFNVLTGESLGIFEVNDACISDDGSLLTIKGYNGSYFANANKDMPDIKLYYPTIHNEGKDLSITTSQVGEEGWATDSARLIPFGGVTTVVIPRISYKTQKTMTFDNQEGKIEIRKNGIIIKTVPLVDYAAKFKNEGVKLLNKIHNAGSGEETDSAVARLKDGKIYGCGDIDVWRADSIDIGPRPRPKPDYRISIYPMNLRIYKDATFDGYLSIGFYGHAYPFFEHEEFSPTVSSIDVKCEYSLWKASIWDFTILQTGGPAHKFYESKPPKTIDWGKFPVVGLANKNKSVWIGVYLDASGIVRIADGEIQAKLENIYPAPCVIPGPTSNSEYFRTSVGKILPGFDIEYCLLAGGFEYYSSQKYTYTLNSYIDHAKMLDWPEDAGPDGMHYYYKDVTRYDSTEHESNKIIIYSSDYYIGGYTGPYKALKELVNSANAKQHDNRFKRFVTSDYFKLDDNFCVKAYFNQYLNAYVDALELYEVVDGKYHKIISLESSVMSWFSMYWTDIRVGKLKNGIYVISCTDDATPVLFVKNGHIIKSSYSDNRTQARGRTFTLKYFYNRLLLKKRLVNLLGDI